MTSRWQRSRGRSFRPPHRVARIFNTYGPRMAANDGRVVSNFVVQALGKALTIYGDGSQTRSFCFVDAQIEGLMRLGTTECAPDRPINLGNERAVSIAEIGYPVLAVTGSSSGAERLPLPQDDATRARKILGWETSVPLEVGLPSTIDDFRSVL